MYLLYTGIDNYRGLRRGQVYEVEFQKGLDRLELEVTQHREFITNIEYHGVGSFADSWKDVGGKKEAEE